MDPLQAFVEQIHSEIAKHSQSITRFSPQLQLGKPQNRINLDHARNAILTRFTQKYPMQLDQLIEPDQLNEAQNRTQRWLKSSLKFRERYQIELINYCDFIVIFNSPTNLPDAHSAVIPLILSDVMLHSPTQLQITSSRKLNPLIARMIYELNPQSSLIAELTEQIAQSNYTRSILVERLREVFPQLEVSDAKFLAAIGDPKEIDFQRIIQLDTKKSEPNPWAFSPIVAGLLNNQKAIDFMRQQFAIPLDPDLINPQIPDRYLSVFQHLQAHHSFNLRFSPTENHSQLNYQISDLINLIAQYLVRPQPVNQPKSSPRIYPPQLQESADSEPSANALEQKLEDSNSAPRILVVQNPGAQLSARSPVQYPDPSSGSSSDRTSAPSSGLSSGPTSDRTSGPAPAPTSGLSSATASAASPGPSSDGGMSRASNPEQFEPARKTILDYSFELHRKIPGYNISLYEIIAQIIAHDVDWQIAHPAFGAPLWPKPKINPDQLFEIFQHRTEIVQALNQLEHNHHFTVQTLNNPWLFAPVETDQQAAEIKTQLTQLNNELLPALKTMATHLQSTFPQFEFKTMASLSDILAKIIKLVEIYDIFTPDILDLTLSPYLEATAAKPPKTLHFFERRALIKEIRSYIRQGVLVNDLATLHAKLETLDQFLNSTVQSAGSFKDLLPDNLREIIATFDQCSAILASLETLLPHVSIEAETLMPADLWGQVDAKTPASKTQNWLEVPIADLTPLLTALQTQADDVLKSVDQRRQNLKTLHRIQPIADYYYQLIFDRNQDLPAGFASVEFNLTLFSTLYQFAIQSLGLLRAFPVNQFTQAIQYCTQSRVLPPNLPVTFTFLNAPHFNAAEAGRFDLVIFDRLSIHSTTELFPYLALSKSVVNLQTETSQLSNILPTVELSPSLPSQLIPATKPSPFAKAITYYLPAQNFSCQILTLTNQPPADSTIEIDNDATSSSHLSEFIQIKHHRTRKTLVLQLEISQIDTANWDRIFVHEPQILTRMGLNARYYSILEFFIQPQKLIDWFQL